jgi:hypothetical protein
MHLETITNTQIIENNKNESSLFIQPDTKPILYHNRKSLGKVLPLFFKDGEPLIVIGPHCI